MNNYKLSISTNDCHSDISVTNLSGEADCCALLDVKGGTGSNAKSSHVPIVLSESPYIDHYSIGKIVLMSLFSKEITSLKKMFIRHMQNICSEINIVTLSISFIEMISSSKNAITGMDGVQIGFLFKDGVWQVSMDGFQRETESLIDAVGICFSDFLSSELMFFKD
jgi:hypothetical protein